MNLNIVVDVRESGLYDKLISITTLSSNTPKITVLTKPLILGDILIEVESSNEVLVLFERKSLTDLLSSIRDGRYAEQSHRLIHTSNIPSHNIAYIVEGMYSQLRKESEKQTCISAITSLFYFKGFSVFRTCSVGETAELVYGMAAKIQKELASGKTPRFILRNTGTQSETSSDTVETVHMAAETTPIQNAYCEVVHKVKKDNITPENIGEIILCSIPGISSTTAIEIMKHYSSFANFIEEIESRPEKLQDIYLTTNGKKRKLGKNIIENIHRFLGRRDRGANGGENP